MPFRCLRISLCFLTWVCVVLLAILSLLPAQDMVRSGFPGELEHFAAYFGSGAVAMAGIYAGVLGRQPPLPVVERLMTTPVITGPVTVLISVNTFCSSVNGALAT